MLRELERETGKQQATWKGISFPVVPTQELIGHTVVMGGHEESIALAVVVRHSALPASISADLETLTADNAEIESDNNTRRFFPGEIVTFRNRQYRFLSVQESPEQSHWLLTFSSIDR